MFKSVLFAPVGDLLHDCVDAIEEWRERRQPADIQDIRNLGVDDATLQHVGVDPASNAITMPTYADSDELAIVLTFMDVFRVVEDFFPGEFADRWRPRLLEKIREAASVAHELRALQRTLYAEALQLREARCQAEHGCSLEERERRENARAIVSTTAASLVRH